MHAALTGRGGDGDLSLVSARKGIAHEDQGSDDASVTMSCRLHRRVSGVGGRGGGPTSSENDSAQRYGVAQEALTLLSNEANVSNSANGDTRDPRIAWLRLPDQGPTQVAGRGLIGFSRLGLGGWRANWAYSINWAAAGNPSWQTFASNSGMPGVKWPAPDNLCERWPTAFECDQSGAGWNAAQWASTRRGGTTRLRPRSTLASTKSGCS